MSCWQVTLENPIVRFVLCKDWFVKENMEIVLDIATDRVDRQLDVRSLIMTQNLVNTLIKLVIKPQTNRQLMRIQRTNKIIEPNFLDQSINENANEMNLAISHDSEQ